jgi:hypothetical protein
MTHSHLADQPARVNLTHSCPLQSKLRSKVIVRYESKLAPDSSNSACNPSILAGWSQDTDFCRLRLKNASREFLLPGNGSKPIYCLGRTNQLFFRYSESR